MRGRDQKRTAGHARVPRKQARGWLPVCLCAVGGILALLVILPVNAQRSSKTVDDPCNPLLQETRTARSLKDLRERIQRKRSSKQKLEACAEALRQDPRVQAMVERERRQHVSLAMRMARVKRARSSRNPAKHDVNQRVLRARQQAKARLRVVEAQRPEPRPRGAPTADIVRINPLPVVPGTDLVIEGMGFGNGGGVVEFSLQGQTFEPAVNEWTDTWISAYLSDDIEGVTETSGAVIRVQPSGGPPLSRTVPFVPVYESTQLNDLANALHAFPLPGDRHETFASGWSLQNGWRLAAEPWTQSVGGIQCEIDGPPIAEPGTTELATRVHVAWDWFQLPHCFVFFEIEGPKGFENGFENPLL